MPTKDLTGPPPPTAEEKALLIELRARLGLQPPRRSNLRDDGSELVPPPSDPKPSPMTGGAAVDFGGS